MTSEIASITPIILSGGSETRLWPGSRSLHPKQLLSIAAARSMPQATVGRLAALDFAAPIVVGGEEHRLLVADQLAEMACVTAAIVLEPAGRNTAAVIALAAHHAQSGDADAVLFVVPSNHFIADLDAFRRAVATGAAAAADGWLVTFGIAPAGPKPPTAISRSGGDRGRRRGQARRALHREAQCLNGRRFRRRRAPPAERRHLSIPRRPIPVRARCLRARYCRRLGAR